MRFTVRFDQEIGSDLGHPLVVVRVNWSGTVYLVKKKFSNNCSCFGFDNFLNAGAVIHYGECTVIIRFKKLSYRNRIEERFNINPINTSFVTSRFQVDPLNTIRTIPIPN